jgi:hypothetical protein
MLAAKYNLNFFVGIWDKDQLSALVSAKTKNYSNSRNDLPTTIMRERKPIFETELSGFKFVQPYLRLCRGNFGHLATMDYAPVITFLK